MAPNQTGRIDDSFERFRTDIRRAVRLTIAIITLNYSLIAALALAIVKLRD